MNFFKKIWGYEYAASSWKHFSINRLLNFISDALLSVFLVFIALIVINILFNLFP